MKLDDLDDEEDMEEKVEGEVEGDEGGPSSPTATSRGTQDCPLTFHRAAMLARMPLELKEHPEGVVVWSTLLAMTHLQKQPFCWLASDPEEEDELEMTIVDAARTFIVERCHASRRLRRLFKSGAPQAAAVKALKRWQLAREYAVERVRMADSVSKHKALHFVQRAVSRVVKSVHTDHSTFSVLLDADGFVMRWQRFMILLTLLMAALLCAITFYSSRGSLCCAEIRGLLDSGAGAVCPGQSAPITFSPPPPAPPPFPPPSTAPSLFAIPEPPGCDPSTPAGPCLGYLGSCGDLPSQFATLQGAYVYGDPGAETCQSTLTDYVCHQFPDDAVFTDQFFVSLICVAIALPVTLFLENLFERANEVEGQKEGWLKWGGKWKIVMGVKAVAEWHWTDKTRKPPTELVRWLTNNTDAYFSDTVSFFLGWSYRRLLSLVFGKKEEEMEEKEGGEREKDKAEQSEAGESVGSERRMAEDRWAARSRQLRAAGGLIGVYVAWACFSYFTFGASLQCACIRISHSPPQSTECVLAAPALHRPNAPSHTPSPLGFFRWLSTAA